jgi:hypothetical protein
VSSAPPSEAATPEQRFVRRALAVRAFLRDPALPGFALMVALVLGGFGAIAYAWYGAARTAYVPLQLPEIVSGGIGGIALIGVGLALFTTQLDRRDAAREKRLTDETIDEMAGVVALRPKLRRLARRLDRQRRH